MSHSKAESRFWMAIMCFLTILCAGMIVIARAEEVERDRLQQEQNDRMEEKIDDIQAMLNSLDLYAE